jgi:glycosyltransferase involved in cell wall biosynthesis
MPVYNAARYLRVAIESILCQSFRQFELIIIDDGSSDETPQIIAQYASRDPRIRVTSRENRGLVASLNEGLSLARGQLIARMDGDDWSHPERFSKQVRFLSEHPRCAAVGCRVLLIDPDDAPVREISTECEHAQIDQAHLRGIGGTIAHPAVMMRRAAVIQVGGYRMECELAEDLDLFLRLAEHWQLANLPEVLLHYRLHLNSSGTSSSGRQARSAARAVVDACRRRQMPPPDDLKERIDSAKKAQMAPVRHRRTWAWWALNAGHVTTARKHALAAVREDPLSPESWRVMYCAARGR